MSSEKPKHADADEVIRRYYEGEQTGEEGTFPEDTLEPVPRSPSSSEREDDIALSGGDVDTTHAGTDSGEETVGGSVPTPDQDIVDELGKAVGITYEDTEPLRFGDKVADRDAQRWELNPASSEGYQDRLHELSGGSEASIEEPLPVTRPTEGRKNAKSASRPSMRKTASPKKAPKKKR